jgi:hypothetical protein
VRELAAQLGDLGVDPAPVGLDLRLAGSTATDAAALRADASTGLPRQVATPAAQPLLHVVQLGELDLCLALAGLGVLGEDVQDQRGAVHHLHLDPVLEVPELARRQLTVEDHGVRAGGLHDVAEAVDLAASDVRRRVGALPALVERVEHRGPGRLGEQGELGHRVLGVLHRALGPHPDEDHALEAQLAVLDLGDVLELGGQAGDPPQGVPLGEVVVTGAVLAGVRGGCLLGVRLGVPAVGLQQGVVEVDDRVGSVRGQGGQVRVGVLLVCARHIHQVERRRAGEDSPVALSKPRIECPLDRFSRGRRVDARATSACTPGDLPVYQGMQAVRRRPRCSPWTSVTPHASRPMGSAKEPASPGNRRRDRGPLRRRTTRRGRPAPPGR